MSAVTVQVIVPSLGCLIRARLPTPKTPLSIRVTEVIEDVHSGQCSMSVSVAHNRSSEALTAMTTSKPISTSRAFPLLSNAIHAEGQPGGCSLRLPTGHRLPG